MKSKKRKTKKIYSTKRKYTKHSGKKISKKTKRNSKTKRKKKRKRKTKGKKLKGGMNPGHTASPPRALRPDEALPPALPPAFPPAFPSQFDPPLLELKSSFVTFKEQHPGFNPKVYFIVCHGRSIPDKKFEFSNNIVITPNNYRTRIPQWPEGEKKLFHSFLPQIYTDNTSSNIRDKAVNMVMKANEFIARSLEQNKVPLNSPYYIWGRGSAFNFKAHTSNLPDFHLIFDNPETDYILGFDPYVKPYFKRLSFANSMFPSRKNFTLNEFIKTLDISDTIIVAHICTLQTNAPQNRPPTTSGRTKQDEPMLSPQKRKPGEDEDSPRTPTRQRTLSEVDAEWNSPGVAQLPPLGAAYQPSFEGPLSPFKMSAPEISPGKGHTKFEDPGVGVTSSIVPQPLDLGSGALELGRSDSLVSQTSQGDSSAKISGSDTESNTETDSSSETK